MTVTLGAPSSRPSRSPSPVAYHIGDEASDVPRVGSLQRLFPSDISRRGRLASCLLLGFTIGSVSLFLVGGPVVLTGLSPATATDVSALSVLRQEDAATAASLTEGLAPVASVAADGGEPADVGAEAAAPVATVGTQALQEAPSPETLKALWMTRQEAESMLEVMHKDMTYLEYGSGGSTMAFAPMAKRAYSIEHDSTLPRVWSTWERGQGYRVLSSRLTGCASLGSGLYGLSLRFGAGPGLTPATTSRATLVFSMLLLFCSVWFHSRLHVNPSFSPVLCGAHRGMVLADAGETGGQRPCSARLLHVCSRGPGHGRVGRQPRVRGGHVSCLQALR